MSETYPYACDSIGDYICDFSRLTLGRLFRVDWMWSPCNCAGDWLQIESLFGVIAMCWLVGLLLVLSLIEGRNAIEMPVSAKSDAVGSDQPTSQLDNLARKIIMLEASINATKTDLATMENTLKELNMQLVLAMPKDEIHQT